MVSTCSPIFISFTPIIIGITVTFVFHNFFSSLARSKYLCLASFSLSFYQWSTEKAKSAIWLVLFLLFSFLLIIKSLVFWTNLGDPFVSQNPREFCVSYSSEQFLVFLESISQLVVFHGSLSYSKSPKVFRTFLIILADFNNSVICMVSILPFIFLYSFF